MDLIKKIKATLGAALVLTTTLAYAPQAEEGPAQEKPRKEETESVGSYKPIFYRLEEIIDPVTGDNVINPKTGEPELRISNDIEKAYFLSMDNIIKVEIKPYDRVSFYRATEDWRLGEKHLPYQSEIFRAILNELNGPKFNPNSMKPGESIYLPDLDKNQLIVLDKVTHDKIRSLGKLEDLKIMIEDKKVYVQKDDEKILVGEQRGEPLTAEEAYNVIESYRNKTLEKKVKQK
ncbi:MAG TPA: hypothetical protein VJ461_04995 [Candidatus Nanoarchaeia archaeon]|nr:hypothetical protein [Candidatus Nanoarchaeia archaeon]